MTINLVLFDVDGCTFNQRPPEKRDEQLHQWLIEINQNLLQSLIQRINAEKHKKIIYGFSTKRQSKYLDDANFLPCGSCAPILPIIQSHTQNSLSAETFIETALTADFFANPKNGGIKSPGDNYLSMLKNLYCDAKNERFSHTFCDHTKVLNLYMHIHRAAVLNPTAEEIIVDVYDDEEYMLQTAHNYFSALNGRLLPSNVKLRLHQYDGKVLQQYKTTIQGSGSVDKNYEWSIRYFAAKRYLFGGIDAGKDHQLKTAEELRGFHHENRMQIGGRRLETIINESNLKPENFLEFRETEIAKLATESTLGHIPSYTTAQELHQRGFIPERFVLNKKAKMMDAACLMWNQTANTSKSTEELERKELQPSITKS